MEFLNNNVLSKNIITTETKEKFGLTEENNLNDILNTIKFSLDNSNISSNIEVKKGNYIGTDTLGNNTINIGIDFNIFILTSFSSFGTMPYTALVDYNSYGITMSSNGLILIKHDNYNNLSKKNFNTNICVGTYFHNNNRQLASVTISLNSNYVLTIKGPTLALDDTGSKLSFYNYNYLNYTYYWTAIKYLN